ncbi:hypothetical protein SAMN04489858_106136 [Paracoccus homiensis]|uniref:Uncharacterized protein n=1 Tax=Paracoccus homiensis TaxID=364199 RepID=A0A1I0F9A9_9RHOB|nr:hypothetical protein SAMN04489858_106136 [Paracoccus homiensis]
MTVLPEALAVRHFLAHFTGKCFANTRHCGYKR